MFKKTQSYTIKDMSAAGAKELCAAILIQAVRDYQDLNKRRTASAGNKKSGKYSKNEITRFFNSRWCEILLETAGSNLSGSYILDLLQTKNATK